MKRIIIDARLFGPNKTGIGRYTQNLLLSLKNLPDFTNYRFGLIVKTEDYSIVSKLLGNSYDYYQTGISHYSLSEQLYLTPFIKSLKPDLVHFTHFNKPLNYSGLSVITIHDLIKNFFKGRDTTTKNSLLYWPKYWAYRLITDINIHKNSIIVPSNFWRDYLINHYHLDSTKVTTTYEAVDPKFLKISSPAKKIPQDYILYTGNLYPHKNISVILRALVQLPGITLKIISAPSSFTTKVKQEAQRLNVLSQVEFLGFVPDDQFPSLYASAIALVHPSLMEGFSLTGLEAMSLNCPVIAASASCLPEIYGPSVLYFSPHNHDELSSKIRLLQHDTKLRQKLIQDGHLQIKKYSWKKTATDTLSVYEKVLI